MKKKYVIATIKSWNIRKAEEFIRKNPDLDIELITRKEELTAEKLSEISPRYVFIPHWSWIIPRKIFEPFECIIFHMTDLPFGRGGSPMQNLISRGIYKTKISAIRCVKELDAGDVYMKQELDLLGGAEEIFVRASRIIFEEMIPWIIENESVPKPQQGEPVEFKRRKPHEGNISSLKTLDEVFDYIRMLDAEGYPPAFLETENLRLEFSRPKRSLDSVFADVKITKKAE